MKIQVIIPAAGLGTRLQSSVIKPLILIKGKPMLVRCLEVFEKCSLIDLVIIVASEDYIDEFQSVVDQYGIKKVRSIVKGGSRRCDSVRCGLEALDKDTEIVVIHDGARPFIAENLLKECIVAAQKFQAAILAVKSKSTIKVVDDKDLFVRGTLDRNMIWEVQTPQAFQKDVLEKAYEQLEGNNPTDDASLVEQLGVRVKVVEGSYENIKITTQEDLIFAENLSK